MAITYTPHLFKCVEWEMNGEWHCADTSDLVHNSSAWWLPCRLLEITPAEFVLLLKDKYKCDHIKWLDSPSEDGVLYFYWSNQAQMRVYKNWINKVAREKKFYI